ncbi:hypothetical protein JHK85_032342 [Glycine max]|nr:hypothetical protein JHK85_032342 [Glycine max]
MSVERDGGEFSEKDTWGYDGIVYTKTPPTPSPPQHFLLGFLHSTPSPPTTSGLAAASSSPPSPPKRSMPPMTLPSTTAAMPSSQTLVETLSGRSPLTENDNTTHRNGTAKKPKLPYDMHTISEAEIREEFSHHHRGVARINNGSLINADHVDNVSLVDNATTVATVVLQQRMRRVRPRPKEREARRREMVSEKEGWLETKGRSSEERDGVRERGVVEDQREKLRGERGVVGDQR